MKRIVPLFFKKNMIRHTFKLWKQIPSYSYIYLFLSMLIFIYFFFFSNYSFYKGDHSSQLPAVLRYFDQDLYQKDFEMQIINPVSVKFIPHLGLFALSKLTRIPLNITYVTAYVITIFSIIFLLYRIVAYVGFSKITGLLACVFIMFFNQKSLSQFRIFPPVLCPYFFSVPIHLLALYLALQKRYKLSTFIAGLLFYIHGQNSLFVFAALGAVILFVERDWKRLLHCFGLYLLIISPMIISLYLNFFPAEIYAERYSIYQLLRFRNERHFLPSTKKIFLFISLLAGASFLLHSLKLNKRFIVWWYTMTFIIIVGLILTLLYPVKLIMLLYPLRVDVFLRIFIAILISSGIVQFLESLSKWKNLKFKQQANLVCVFPIFTFAVIFFGSLPLLKIPKINPPENSFVDICHFIKKYTPKNSLIISPPKMEGLRLYSQRSTVVEYKTHPIGRGGRMQDEWIARLKDLCGGSVSEENGFKSVQRCQYSSLTKKEKFFYAKSTRLISLL